MRKGLEWTQTSFSKQLFFQTILKSEKYSDEHYSKLISCVYDYIERYWKKTKVHLSHQPFDLEDCFTFLELKIIEADSEGNSEKVKELAEINWRLKILLAEFLSEFDIFSHSSDLLRKFANKIYKEKPIILTFNYDCILESAIASASGVNTNVPDSFRNAYKLIDADIPDDLLSYSHCNWNLPLAYGFEFNEVELQQAGLSRHIEGCRFYRNSKNKLYEWKILKLHGSLNWFRYLPVKLYPSHPSQEDHLPKVKLNSVILKKGLWHFNMPMHSFDGWLMDPLIITPVLYKQRYYGEDIFLALWNQAKHHLSNCSRLIVIGYSFPPTDFNVKKLLLEAFEDNKIDELIVVNPNTQVVATIKDIVHYSKPVYVCHDLSEFLQSNQTQIDMSNT